MVAVGGEIVVGAADPNQIITAVTVDVSEPALLNKTRTPTTGEPSEVGEGAVEDILVSRQRPGIRVLPQRPAGPAGRQWGRRAAVVGDEQRVPGKGR